MMIQMIQLIQRRTKVLYKTGTYAIRLEASRLAQIQYLHTILSNLQWLSVLISNSIPTYQPNHLRSLEQHQLDRTLHLGCDYVLLIARHCLPCGLILSSKVSILTP
jgi:hypothetical protein